MRAREWGRRIWAGLAVPLVAILLSLLVGSLIIIASDFAVSGETGLMYAAVRIANAAHLSGGAERIAPGLTQFVAGFRQAWQPEGEPLLADALDWAGSTLPLNRPEHMEWLRQGLRQMLEPSWPARPGSEG